MAKAKLTVAINPLVLRKYKKFCAKEGFIISQRLENFMKHDLLKKFWEIKV
ncbi:MAG TPA: hypothetical protein HA224_00100 [Nanoarchaeota archaeon]|nr:hypothetical protein [Nanoarchaeota archaeon]